MRPQDLPEIRALPLFADMAEACFETLVRGAYVQTFPPSIDLITEGDPADFLHVVLSGGVEMTGAWNGRDTTLTTVYPLGTFILAATIKDLPYLMSARTLEKTRVVLIPSEDVRKVFSVDHGFARAVVTELAASYRVKVKALKDVKLRTGVERLANYLVRAKGDGPATFELRLEKRRLASLLGMTPENLSRAFGTLKAYGVQVDGSSITLGNEPALRGLAKPTPLIDDPTS
jgi:CRP/FNR family transcriptional activator FtrB